MGLFDDWKGFDVQEERRIGKEAGEEIKLIKMVCKKIVKGRSLEKIAEELEENENHIREIYDTALKFAPDYDAEKIFDALPKKKLTELTTN